MSSGCWSSSSAADHPQTRTAALMSLCTLWTWDAAREQSQTRSYMYIYNVVVLFIWPKIWPMNPENKSEMKSKVLHIWNSTLTFRLRCAWSTGGAPASTSPPSSLTWREAGPGSWRWRTGWNTGNIQRQQLDAMGSDNEAFVPPLICFHSVTLFLPRVPKLADRLSFKCCRRFRQCDYLDFDRYIDTDVPPHKMVFYMYIIPRYAQCLDVNNLCCIKQSLSRWSKT